MEVRWWSICGGDLGVVVNGGGQPLLGGETGMLAAEVRVSSSLFSLSLSFFFRTKGKRKREIKAKPKQKNLSEKRFRSD